MEKVKAGLRGLSAIDKLVKGRVVHSQMSGNPHFPAPVPSMAELKARNIGTGLHYTAAHEFSYYAGRFGWKPEDYPEAHFVSERIVSLPLFPGLTDGDQDDAIVAVREVLAEFQR